ncbi:MAG: SDR family oxidoreductase [Balneolaceae bacterium]|nr:SDR family oxidoreductase [Balneolaceae bacterium]
MNLREKNILVTGGGGFGVGAGICQVLSEFGATIVLNERTYNDAKKASEEYPNAIPVGADISDEKAVMKMFDNIRKEVGIIHGLVNNAGVGLSKPAHKVSEQEFDRVYATDVKGLWMVSRSFINQLLDAGQTGSIVNVSSVHAFATISGYAIYASAKAAVEGFTRGLAVETGPHNIRVNAIAPGYVHSDQNLDLIRTWTDHPEEWIKNHIETEQVLLHEITPKECGYVGAFLLSDMSRSVTGQTIYVDNGSTSLLYNRNFTGKK